LPERAFLYSNERRAPVKLIYAIAFAVSFVAAPVASPAQSRDLPLPSAQCTDDYYEDADGQCDALSAGAVLTIEAILAKYGVVIIGDTDEEVIGLYMDDLEDTPVASIQRRNEDAVATNEKANAEPADEQETIASKVVTVQPPLEIGGEAADDVATTGPTARRMPAATEPVDENRSIE
jgi:hypothetical protein